MTVSAVAGWRPTHYFRTDNNQPLRLIAAYATLRTRAPSLPP